MRKLNEKESAIMAAIKQSIAEQGYAPSVRDLCEMLGYRSTSTVQMYLERLERYGYIRRRGGKSRSIALCEDGRSPRQIPLLRADVPHDAPLCEDVIGGWLDFCYCGEIPDGAELFAYEMPSKDGREVAVVARQTGETQLRTLAVIKLF